MVREKEEIEQEDLRIKEWMKEDDEMGNMFDPYYEL